MKVAVLGGSGLLGARILHFLASQKINVVNFSRRDLIPGIKFKAIGDIFNNSEKELRNLVQELGGFDHIFYCLSSGSPATGDKLFSSLDFLQKAKQETLFFELLALASYKGRLYYMSSAGAIYGEVGNEMCTETSICNPISHYGIAKFIVERHLDIMTRTHGLKVVILRITNIFAAPDQNEFSRGVITNIVHCCVNSLPFTIIGDGSESRDYIFVEDIVFIISLLLRKKSLNDFELFNIASKNTYNVLELIEIISHSLQKKLTINFSKRPTSYVTHSNVSNDKIMEVLGNKNMFLKKIEEVFS